MATHRPARELTIGVVGTGAMGAGIAELMARGGHSVLMQDTRQHSPGEARDRILARMDRRVRDGRATPSERSDLEGRLHPASSLEALGSCGVVIEAIAERLDAKRALFSDLAALVPSDTILATNTSSLPIGAIAAGNPAADRIAGLHFFNPVPVMRLVEVIPGPETRDDVIETLMSLVHGLGHAPVLAKDTPGFLVNFGGRAFLTEGLAILQERVAKPAQVDAVMRDVWGFRMGPFELMDLTGMDVNLPVTEFIHQRSFADPRMRSTALHRYMYETGQLGRKTGRGYYDHAEGAAAPSPDHIGNAEPARAVALADDTPALAAMLQRLGIDVLEHDDGRAPLVCAPTGEDVSAFSARTGTDHRRLVGVDTLGNSDVRVTLMCAPGIDPDVRESAAARFARHRRVTLIGDSPGFIGQRVSAMIANLGCEMAQIGLATPDDIDTAIRLGLNYPAGPLELADTIGAGSVHEILQRIQALTGDDRYRPSQWLRRRAQLGLSARHPQ